jgi:MFS family permease
MVALTDKIAPLSDRDHRNQLTRAIIASTIGTTIEWYDFFLYGTVTGLVFAKLYFPGSDPFVGTLNVFAIYAVGFVARPIGASIFGHYGDRIGRKNMYRIGALAVTVFGFAYFYLLDTKDPVLMFLAIMLSIVPHGMMYGPQAALIAELFTGRLRYTGASIGYQLASIIAGGPAPLIAAWLLQQYGSGYAIAGFIAVCGIISLIALSFMKDYTGEDIALEYDDA